MFTIEGKRITITVNPEKATFAFTLSSGAEWTMSGRPYVELTDGTVFCLDEAEMQFSERKTGTWHGCGIDYTLSCGLILHTLVYIENTRDDIYFVSRLEGDTRGQVQFVSFPSAVDFNGTEAGHGYTVLPRMQGTLIPAGSPIRVWDGTIYERDAYMPIFGQVRDGSGYLAIYDTPYDAKYKLRDENVEPLFRTSLGYMAYPRKMLYRFFGNCDYNDFAHSYRDYLAERGEIYTLAEKCVKNPAVERLIGVPIIHEGIATHISPESDYYNRDDPAKNDYYTSFAARAEQLRALREKGLDEAYIHLDGWGNHGYDNLHPDPFPPHEGAGGAEGMKQLSDTARELGYIFGIHDQYRDYYYDAPSFDMNNAIENIDGSHPFCSVWYGGPHSWLCASLAPEYVRRNYDEFERLGITIEGSYLDVFSVVFLDECFNPEHPMTRKQCADARNECLNILTARGIIPSSEETLGCMMKSQVLCHHAPFFTSDLGSGNASAVGIPIPLYNLVYHDCVVIPWIGGRETRGGWGIPGTDSPWIYAILNGNPVYCPILADEKRIAEVKEACAVAKKLAKQQMVKHEFLNGTYRKQRTTWADGTIVEADLDDGSYSVVSGDTE
ncbi:MAG: hypothetical protein IJ497_11795 [Clostridia bacterium]|nr:hypothetical protein [Clostridia bacterium]